MSQVSVFCNTTLKHEVDLSLMSNYPCAALETQKMIQNPSNKLFVNPNKTGNFEGSFFWVGQFDPPSYFTKTNSKLM